MFAFQSKEKFGSSSEELSSETSAKNRPFAGDLSNSGLIQLLSGSASNAPESPNASSSQNTSGVPSGLKAKYEQCSGVSMDDVSVHYNSDKPVQYGALAYTQGNDVYLGPGQEKHLGHELGHVIQQKQGRVPVTGSVGGAPLNDNPALEQEADTLLSGNSPVQHITAGYYPDSGAPIQRLRINLAGDNKDSKYPEVRQTTLFQIATGGERLDVPDGDHDKVKETVVACQKLLAIDEDIVFEGHGNRHSPCFHVTTKLQDFSPKELAEMAAAIKKPEDWKGRILLFGCRTGNIALQVAKEYYILTKKSVTVVGPKEITSILLNVIDPTLTRFGFFDSQKRAALKSDLKFQFVEKITEIFYKLLPSLKNLSSALADASVQSNQKANEAFAFLNGSLIPLMNTLNQELKSTPDGFQQCYPNMCSILRSLSTNFRSIMNTSLALFKNINSSKPNDWIITRQIEGLHKPVQNAIDLCQKIYDEYFQKKAAAFKSFLDFEDDKMMTSAIYPTQHDDIAYPLPQWESLFGAPAQDNRNSLFSAKLFERPNCLDPLNPPAKWSDLFKPSDTK